VAVAKGQELATVVSNLDPNPVANYFSINFLYNKNGLVGANSRNERNPAALDTYYGLDPRELVGYSTTAGATWSLPGGPYGVNGGKAFVPTYIAEYADGSHSGQPYYYSVAVSGTQTMVYPNVPVPWTITELGAYTSGPGTGTVSLIVDGVVKATATLDGSGMLRASILPVLVAPGSTVKVSTTLTAGGLNLRRLQADTVWSTIMGLGPNTSYYLEGDPTRAVPLYALPRYISQ
jgi:hypothetical protein